MKVKDIMTRHVYPVSGDTSIFQTAMVMKGENIGFIPVIEDKAVVGCVTDRDIVLAIARGLTLETPIRQAMSKGVITIDSNESIGNASVTMGEFQVRRLVVVENGEACGVISIGDIAINELSNGMAGDALTNISYTTINKKSAVEFGVEVSDFPL